VSNAADKPLTQRQADVLGRQFNSALMNTTAYGPTHSVSRRTYDTFAENLAETLEKMESVTLLFDRGSLFIEDFSLDTKFNPTRLARVFRALGVESVTFEPGVDADALQVLMEVLSAHEDYAGVAALKTELDTREITTIRINHVVMRKFTENEEVIDREGLEQLTEMAEKSVAPPFSMEGGARGGGGPGTGDGSAISVDLMERVENIFSMRELIARPDDVAGQVLARSRSDAEDRRELVDQIRGLRTELRESRTDETSAVSLGEVMEAVTRVRGELADTMASQNEIARFMTEHGGEVLDEVDQLTFDTVLMIVRDEYRDGTTSVKRLAQILRRVLPDARDLKRFLPLLKQGLLDEGMPLADYIALVSELGTELRSDDLVHALEQGSENVGLSVEELVREIRRDPGEAARLVVLAAELRQAGRPDEDRLSTVLSDYIGRISSELVEHSGENVDQSVKSLRKAVRQTQQKLVREVCSHGVSAEVGSRVERQLAGHVDDSIDRIRVRGLVGKLKQSETLDESELAARLARMFEHDTDLERIGTTLKLELEQCGYSPDSLKRIFEQTERRLRNRSRLELLPNGMLEPNVINYLLEREIASCRRFGTYFACLLLMVARIRPADAGESDWRSVQPEEIEHLLPQVFRTLPPHVRDIDLLGSMGTKERNIPLVLLTMAQQDGAQIVLERMLDALAETRFELDGKGVFVDAIGIAESFDLDKTPDRKSFLNDLQSRLASRLVKRLRE